MLRTVLITGASRGIGRAAARLFAEKGYKVAINYNNSEEKAISLKNEIIGKGFIAEVFRADVSNYLEVESMFKLIEEKLGAVDVLINNAAISEHKLFLDMTHEDWSRMLDVNLNGCFNTIKRALPNMVSQKLGKIINISSIWGIDGASMESHYSASKAAVIGLTKALAKEYALSNIQINCISPGVIDTDMNKLFNDAERQDIIDAIPLGRMGKAEEVAELMLYLASKGDYITGQNIVISGGL